MLDFSSAQGAFVCGVAVGAFLGILYALVVLGADRTLRGARRRRGRVKTVAPPASRTMPLRRG